MNYPWLGATIAVFSLGDMILSTGCVEPAEPLWLLRKRSDLSEKEGILKMCEKDEQVAEYLKKSAKSSEALKKKSTRSVLVRRTS